MIIKVTLATMALPMKIVVMEYLLQIARLLCLSSGALITVNFDFRSKEKSNLQGYLKEQ